MPKMTQIDINIGELVSFSEKYMHEIHDSIKKLCIDADKRNKSYAINNIELHDLVRSFSMQCFTRFVAKKYRIFGHHENTPQYINILQNILPYMGARACKYMNTVLGNIEIYVNAEFLSLMQTTDTTIFNDISPSVFIDSLPFKSFKLTTDKSFGKASKGEEFNSITITRSFEITVENENTSVLNITYGDGSITLRDKPESMKELLRHNVMATVLNIILYMSTYTDITARDSDTIIPVPEIKYNKKLKIFTGTPKKPLELGFRIGSKLKAHYDPTLNKHIGSNSSSNQDSNRKKVVPHVKRAHWATYYIGPRKDEYGERIPLSKQESILKLKAPIFVGFNLNDDLNLIVTRRELE